MFTIKVFKTVENSVFVPLLKNALDHLHSKHIWKCLTKCLGQNDKVKTYPFFLSLFKCLLQTRGPYIITGKIKNNIYTVIK